MTRTERTEILPELTPKIIDLKLARTENDPYRTKLDPNIFFLNHFSFHEKSIGLKINWPKSRPDPKPNQPEIKHESNHVDPKWPDPKLTWSESEPNDPFARSIYPHGSSKEITNDTLLEAFCYIIEDYFIDFAKLIPEYMKRVRNMAQNFPIAYLNLLIHIFRYFHISLKAEECLET